jgi:hypothetical protein
LIESSGARVLARKLLEYNWVPVGAGIKKPSRGQKIVPDSFPGDSARKIVCEIDSKWDAAGLEGIRLMEPYFEKAGAL